jgi:hypothetical protein
MATLMYVVFCQGEAVDTELLERQAARLFRTTLRFSGADGVTRVHLACARPAADGHFQIAVRASTAADLEAARKAEQRGRAAGMSALAERCPFLWEIRAVEDAEPAEPASAALLLLCAICASVALGPVLPPDGATLFGVRGALERAERPRAS